VISVTQLRKRYEDLEALRGISLEIPAGEVCGLVGPNGAGKSTLLKILATLTPPGAGTASVAGHDVRRAPDAVRRQIGYVPESFGVYEGMRLREYLEFFASAYQIPSQQRGTLIADLLLLTDLDGKVQAEVQGLSRGMKQRLALARALLHDPPVLLLDEPTSGLDPRARLEFASLIRELAGQGKTILVSSHLLEDLAGFCTSVLMLEQGAIITHESLHGITDDDGMHGVEIEMLAEEDAAEALLSAEPSVRRLVRENRRIRFNVDGDADEVLRLHRKLVTELPVLWFRERRDKLLEAFLRKTEGQVS
jgi:ABC-2 type transport system ATP-binding protein